jgi:ubiquinone/menaquinone biosynthesis C-methylase UbiE/uncharacterized protein YbaR (Trm112 family)
MNQVLGKILVCPRDHTKLETRDDKLRCDSGHEYPMVDDVPVMLLAEAEQTLWVAKRSLERAWSPENPTEDDLFLDTLGISDDERTRIKTELQRPGNVDAVVRYLLSATNGILYKDLQERLEDYPIPEIRVPPSGGTFLDVGCNWGRWSVAASRKGYEVIGIDPSLGAVLAARRLSKQMKLSCQFVVADARFLPFADSSFQFIFSYSVLQHLSKPDVIASLKEIARALRIGGTSLIQMPNALGIRSLYHQARRRFREPNGFEVRYWTAGELLRVFAQLIGPTELSVDGFLGLGVQKAEARAMPMKSSIVVNISEMLKRVCTTIPLLCKLADSVYLTSYRAA